MISLESHENYPIHENRYSIKGTIDLIQNEYKQAFIYPFSACKNSNECKLKTFDKCQKILPSKDDHIKSLKIINFLRHLAGITTNIIEDEIWNQQCYKVAINLQKIGNVPSDHLIQNDQAIEEYCGDDSNVQFTNNSKLIITENSITVFESLKKIFINEKVDDQMLFLNPNLKKIGFGYYPFRIDKSKDIDILKPSITVVKVFDKRSFDFQLNHLKFISWPPEGFFPHDLLQSNWFLIHNDFIDTELNYIKIFIQREDGIELEIESKSIKNNALIIKMNKKKLKNAN